MAADGASRPKKNRAFGLRDLQWQWTYAAVASFGLGHVFGHLLGPRRRRRPRAGATVHAPQAAAFVGAFVGCLTTLFLSEFGMAAGVASALATTLLCGLLLVTRAASLLPGEFFVALYGGTFAGMTPVAAMASGDGATDPSAIWLSLLFAALSLVCGVAFWIMAEIDVRSGRKLARGYGGRAGTIATVASFAFVQLAPLFGADDGAVRARAEMADPDMMSAVLAAAACASGMFVTMLVLRRPSFAPANAADRTFVAAALALIGLIALHIANPSDIGTPDAFYAGCFLGMSTSDRLKGWSQPLLAAVVLSAMLVLVRTFLPGVGGSLGFAAFVTVAVLALLDRIASAATAKIPVRAIAIPVASVLAIGCLVLPGRYAPEEPAPDATASAQADGEAMPAQLVLIETKSAPVNEALPSAPPVKADTAELRGSADVAHAAQVPDGQARAAAEPPTQATVDATAPAATEPARSESPVDDVMESHEKLFREFLQWRAARTAGLAQPAPQPVRRIIRSGSTQVIGLLSHAVPQPLPRPPRPVLSAAHDPGSPALAHPALARRPAHNTAVAPAPDRLVP